MPSSSRRRDPVPSNPEQGALPMLLSIAARPQTLLLVEDSRFAAETVRLLCRLAGIRLRRAETLAEARRHLRSYRPDLALVDLGLPDGPGLELIADLAGLESHRPRIVAVSGDADLAEAALAAGADAFRAKPLDLAGQLEALLDLPLPAARGILARRAAGDDAGEAPGPAADPMALLDDLRRAHALLHAGGPVGYAGQFVGGIARMLDDAPLLAAAELARRRGRLHPLLAALERRVAIGPAI
jgi:CheY-like chemotaxis protein